MNRITPRQWAILEALRDHLAECGVGLTVRELGERVGLASSSSASHRLHRLEAARLLTRSGREWTTVTLTGAAVKLLAHRPLVGSRRVV
ncbi:LexA family protein [Streptomyces sp. NBC_00096]|uniref:LexA family protein n=1 Tax=Streptomyces sp. NBC_00096 TaxID=2975650 RepID=UPI00325370E6